MKADASPLQEEQRSEEEKCPRKVAGALLGGIKKDKKKLIVYSEIMNPKF
ncbi:MAG: hypothetical protein MJY45_03350 [Bacteroidales bacterium]|nr:hypothetical protein [Bacteroidales bacterium]